MFKHNNWNLIAFLISKGPLDISNIWCKGFGWIHWQRHTCYSDEFYFKQLLAVWIRVLMYELETADK